MSRIVAIDPGAVRLGWAVVEQVDGELRVADSGILGLERPVVGGKKQEFQVYKMRLVDYFVQKVPVLYRKHRPTALVNETQPAVGGGNFIAATQSELAKTAATIFQAFAFAGAMRVVQLGATTIKKQATGDSKATKSVVRNAVIQKFPDLAEELKRETTGKNPAWDRSDAIATAIAHFAIENKASMV